MTCENVPWATHTPQCKLHGWLSTASSGNRTTSLPVGDVEQGQDDFIGVDAHTKAGMSKEEMETTKEDGELPSLVPVAAVGVSDANLTPIKGSDLEHLGRLSLASMSIMSPLTPKGKSPGLKKQEDEIDLMLESENELDEPVQAEEQSDNLEGSSMIKNLWADYGIQEYTLVLTQKLDYDGRIMKLEAKVRPLLLLLLLFSHGLFTSYP